MRTSAVGSKAILVIIRGIDHDGHVVIIHRGRSFSWNARGAISTVRYLITTGAMMNAEYDWNWGKIVFT